MEIFTLLTDSEEVQKIYGCNQPDLAASILQKMELKITDLNISMKYDLSYGAIEILDEMIAGVYKHDDPNSNFNYGQLYIIICEYFGKPVDFYHDYAANFIYDKFPKEMYDQKAFFPLPKMDFPDIVSIEYANLPAAKEMVQNVTSYNNEFIKLSTKELDELKKVFLDLFEQAENEKKAIVFMMTD